MVGPPLPPPYFGSYRQLAATRSNPLISAILWQLMATCGFLCPSLISANLCLVNSWIGIEGSQRGGRYGGADGVLLMMFF